jgi:hypothetical protein
MEKEYKADHIVDIFVTMKATPRVTMFDWLRLVEELNYAMDNAVSQENWDSFHVYGSSSDAFERLPQVCYQATVTIQALGDLRSYIEQQGDWIIPVGIHVTTKV